MISATALKNATGAEYLSMTGSRIRSHQHQRRARTGGDPRARRRRCLRVPARPSATTPRRGIPRASTHAALRGSPRSFLGLARLGAALTRTHAFALLDDASRAPSAPPASRTYSTSLAPATRDHCWTTPRTRSSSRQRRHAAPRDPRDHHRAQRPASRFALMIDAVDAPLRRVVRFLTMRATILRAHVAEHVVDACRRSPCARRRRGVPQAVRDRPRRAALALQNRRRGAAGAAEQRPRW